MNGFVASVIACALSIITAMGHATEVKFIGTGSYEINGAGGAVTVNFDQLKNVDPDTRSGTLHLQLMASPDSNPDGSFYELTETQNLSTFTGGGRGVLEPGGSFTNITFTTSYTAPPPGTYHIFLAVFEHPELTRYLDTVPAQSNPQYLGKSNPGSGGTPDRPDTGSPVDTGGLGDLIMNCPCRRVFDGDFATLQVTEVRNTLNIDSGTLKLALWATDTPYTGDDILGYVVSEARLGELKAGSRFTDLSETRALVPPPPGGYFLTLTLMEFQNNEFRIVDSASFEPYTFSTTNSGSTGGGGGGSGGGGSFGLMFALLLGLAALGTRSRGFAASPLKLGLR